MIGPSGQVISNHYLTIPTPYLYKSTLKMFKWWGLWHVACGSKWNEMLFILWYASVVIIANAYDRRIIVIVTCQRFISNAILLSFLWCLEGYRHSEILTHKVPLLFEIATEFSSLFQRFFVQPTLFFLLLDFLHLLLIYWGLLPAPIELKLMSMITKSYFHKCYPFDDVSG